MKHIQSISLGIALLAAGYFALGQFQGAKQVSQLEAKLLESRKTAENLQAKVALLEQQIQRTLVASRAAPIPPTVIPPPAVVSGTPLEENRAIVRVDDADVDAAVASVDRLVALTKEEREALALAVRQRGDDDVDASAREVLGDLRFRDYRNAQLDFRKRIRSDVTEREVFTLSRKLRLSDVQENRLQGLIVESRETFLPLTLEDAPEFAMLSRAERTRRKLEAELNRQQYLSDKLREVLDDNQYNQYLELQANSAANQSHQSYVDVAATPTPGTESQSTTE